MDGENILSILGLIILLIILLTGLKMCEHHKNTYEKPKFIEKCLESDESEFACEQMWEDKLQRDLYNG